MLLERNFKDASYINVDVYPKCEIAKSCHLLKYKRNNEALVWRKTSLGNFAAPELNFDSASWFSGVRLKKFEI